MRDFLFSLTVPPLWLNIEDVMGDSSFYGALDMDRPRTAGVHITVHPVGKVNPSPVEIDETEQLIEEYLSPRKLVSLRVKAKWYIP